MSVVLVCAMAGAAAAQTPAPAEPAPGEPAPASVSDPASSHALEQQVTDQLAQQGIALRRNLGVRVEPAGAGPWTVALVDRGNGRVAASVQVDAPADPEAALPVVTRAAADLAEQVGQRVNEIKFKLMSLRFDPAYESPTRRGRRAPRQWQVFRGERGEELATPEFFAMVGRDDLATSYRRRHLVMVGSYAVAVAGFATAIVLTIESRSPLTECQTDQGDEGQICLQKKHRTVAPVVVALAAGLAGVAVGTYLYRHPQPIDEDDARSLADAYNQRLRGALGIRTARRSSARLREVALVPYLGRSDAGLVLGGRF